MGYVVAFNRDRDAYQVPLALAEGDVLERLVTDYYFGRTVPKLSSLAHRAADGIPGELVETADWAFWLQVLGRGAGRLFGRDYFPRKQIDRSIAFKAKEVASLRDANMLIYSGYAFEAFRHITDANRILFQYHPSPGYVRQALRSDRELSEDSWSLREVEEGEYDRDLIHELEVASSDYFICASSVTKRSLMEDGVAADRIAVVPYGATPLGSTALIQAVPAGGRDVDFLFVGQGIRRKGLHVLAAAMDDVRLRRAKFVFVCSRMDPVIGSSLAQFPNATILRGVSRDVLTELYRRARTFVLPSMLEGFGLVIGEALSNGCRVIGSDQTGLPDYDPEWYAGQVVEAGSVLALREALIEDLERRDKATEQAIATARVAANYSWERFREGLRSAVRESEKFKPGK